MIQVQFTGMDLVYDGSNIYDAGSSAGGSLNPLNADPLTSVVFSVGNSTIGTLTSDIALDVSIPDVTQIPAGANVVDNQTTPGNPGYFDLLIGTGPLASQFLAVDLGQAQVTYIDVQGSVQFTFGASVSSTSSANLPFGLLIGQPVEVSFSAQIVPGSLTNNGTFVTGFRAAGTGEYRGPLVPEPSSGLFAAMAAAAGLLVRRK